MKNIKLKTIATVLVGLLMMQGVAFADGDADNYHHSGSSTFWDNGGGWAVFAAAVIFGGIILYRTGNRSNGNCGKSAQLSPENLKPIKSDPRLQLAVLSGNNPYDKEINGGKYISEENSAETVKMAMVLNF